MKPSDLTIKPPPAPRQDDIDAFAVWLMAQDEEVVDRAKIHCTPEGIEKLIKPGKVHKVVSLGGKLIAFNQNGYLVHDFGDYRLTYDASPVAREL
jgi:hypothetical protein